MLAVGSSCLAAGRPAHPGHHVRRWPLGWATGAVFYEVFVRSFQDSDGDGKGDLAGLISRLDYLSDGNPATDGDLGVDALWLMPVFASPSYHGYDTTDYEAINPDYGTSADFDGLIREAHRRGIRIIVDLVVNHTSARHPWFGESASSPSSPRRDWYVWRADDPDALLVGEVWTKTPTVATYYGSTQAVPGGDELPLNFDFELAERIVEGVKTGEVRGIVDKLREVQVVYPPGATDVPFLTNHDQIRLATQLEDTARLRSAAAILLTLPGTPFLYYGEEIGLPNGPGNDDKEKRTLMPWDATPGAGFTTGTPWHPFVAGHGRVNVAAQTADPASLLSLYRKLIRARHASPALARGSLELLTQRGPVLAFVRRSGDGRVLVAINLGDHVERASLAVTARRADLLVTSTGAVTAEPTSATVQVTLPPHESGLFHLR